MKGETPAKCRGSIAVISALSIVVLIATIGLALDSGLGYIIRTKLNAAVDSAGIAAARAVSQGSSQATQSSNAIQAAQAFFAANYPAGYMGSTPTFDTPTVSFNGGQITIGTSASAAVNVNFLQILGFNLLNVSAAAQTTRKDLDMAFVVDTTGSMSSVASQVKTSAQSFLAQFNATTDRVALIHFAIGGVTDVPFKADQSRGFDVATMDTDIQNYVFGATTNYSEGLWQARNQLNNVIQTANRSTLRVIVFFSDGAPNAFASYFAFKVPANCALAGSVVTGDTQTGNPGGLYHYDQQNQRLGGACYQGTNIASYLTGTAIPAFYNAHNPADTEFPLVPNPAGMRSVTASPTWTNINRSARNLAEEMADKSRSEGIYIYTLGLGPNVQAPSGPDNEVGEVLLKNMAHTPDSSKFNLAQYAGQPVGAYCWAATTANLGPCFSKLASEILRLTR